MSEAELHVLRARMLGGYMAKARRGELQLRLPVGFVYDAAGKVQFDPDRQVQDAVRTLFATFRRTGSAGAAARTLFEQACASRAAHRTVRAWAIWCGTS